MSCPSFVEIALSQLAHCRRSGDAILVDTHCLYPSGKTVTVAVLGGPTQAVVHDNGGACDTLGEHGVELEKPNDSLKRFAKARDLNVENGQIVSPPVSADWLPVAILLVANASKDAADTLLNKHNFNAKSDFRRDLKFLFRNKYGDKRFHENYKVFGKTESQYKFDYALKIDKKIILVDAVLPDRNSINSRVVANLDVHHLHQPDIFQRIVYDENDKWGLQDLKLLRTGAPVVPYQDIQDELENLITA